MSTPQPTDITVVNRAGIDHKVTVENLMSKLQDTDWIALQRSSVVYKISGADFKASMPSGSPLTPAVPPFGAVSSLAMNLSSPTGNVIFSTNRTNWNSTASVPINTPYYVDWGTAILSAAQGTSFTASIKADYTDLGTSETFDLTINSIDKVPDQLTITPQTDTPANNVITANTLYPTEYNAPASIWVSTDAQEVELQIGRGGWFTAPTSPGVAYISPNEELMVRHRTQNGSGAVSTTTVNIGWDASTKMSTDFVSTNLLSSVAQPSITSPTQGSNNNRIYQLSITSSAFSGVGDASSHVSTDWQIASDENYTSIVAQSQSNTTNKTSWTATLPSAGTYYFRVRYNGSGGYQSNWSESVSANCINYYYHRYVVTITGGKGGKAGWGGSPGGAGGSGTFYLETTTPTASAPSSTFQHWVGNNGQDAVGYNYSSGGSGYNNGGRGAWGSYDGPNSRSSSGAGGGSSALNIDGTLVCGLGAGGGGGGGDNSSRGGGSGGSLSSSSTLVNGGGGGGEGWAGPGAGGSGSTSGSNGSDAQQRGTEAATGGGGAGFSGGGNSNSTSWNGAGGGGGGGSFATTLDGTIAGKFRMYNVGPGDGTPFRVVHFVSAEGASHPNWNQSGSLTRNQGQNSSFNVNSIA